MKRKEITELGQKSVGELQQLLQEAKELLFTLHLDKVQFKTKNMRAVFNKRKDIARIATKLREKEIAQ